MDRAASLYTFLHLFAILHFLCQQHRGHMYVTCSMCIIYTYYTHVPYLAAFGSRQRPSDTRKVSKEKGIVRLRESLGFRVFGEFNRLGRKTEILSLAKFDLWSL